VVVVKLKGKRDGVVACDNVQSGGGREEKDDVDENLAVVSCTRLL
jgi:hypothetical protein